MEMINTQLEGLRAGRVPSKAALIKLITRLSTWDMWNDGDHRVILSAISKLNWVCGDPLPALTNQTQWDVLVAEALIRQQLLSMNFPDQSALDDHVFIQIVHLMLLGNEHIAQECLGVFGLTDGPTICGFISCVDLVCSDDHPSAAREDAVRFLAQGIVSSQLGDDEKDRVLLLLAEGISACALRYV
jgi:hypothetical protein